MTRYPLIAMILFILAGCAQPEPNLCKQQPPDRSYTTTTTTITHQPADTLVYEGSVDARVSGEDVHLVLKRTVEEGKPIPPAEQTYGELIVIAEDKAFYSCNLAEAICYADPWNRGEDQSHIEDDWTFISNENVCPDIPTLQDTRNDFITVGHERIDGFETTHYKDAGPKRHTLAPEPKPEHVLHEERHYWITDGGMLVRRQTFLDNPEDRYPASAAEQYPNGRIRQEQELTEITTTISNIGEENDIINPRTSDDIEVQ